MSQTMAPRSSDLAYDIALLFWRTVISIFFREIRPRGAFNIPRDGPVIFVAAPHHNQFLDPLLLTSEVNREVRRRVEFLIAAKSMKRKVIGFFASLMSSIPVARAADEAKPGTGRILLSENDPCVIIGRSTRFKSEFSPKCQIMLPKSIGSMVAEVTEVISDTELRIKKEFGGDSGKGTARVREKLEEGRESGQDGLEFKCMPFIDQQEMYRFVYQRLKEGGCIGIFPEGGSHDRTDLLPLKAGVSLMALGTMANNPSLRVQIVPVGLSYFHAHRFRSRAVIEFGAAMDVPSELVELFKQGGPQKREASGKLLDLIYESLKTVTLRAPDYETLLVIQAARRLYETPGQHLTLGQVVELNKRFLEAYRHFQDDPRVQKLRDDVLKYNRLVRDLGLRDHQVPRAQRASWKTLGLLTYRLGLLATWSILALPGIVLNGPIFILASVISRRKAKEALAASTVKIAGRDVLATWKVLISLGFAPVLYGFYAFLATLVAVKANLPLYWRIWTPFLVMTILPFMSYAALKFGEAGMDVLKSLRPLVVALFPGQQKYLDRLKKMRVSLSNQLSALIDELGPKLWDDFDNWRILVPSASVPPSTGKPGLWRRKSSTGAVDAQGNLLVHPMTWLDERLFGWSRSTTRGTSAWAGLSSQEHSRHASPEASDSEDEGDYDNILGYLPSDGTGTPSRSRARSVRSSYADLQQLKMTNNNTSTVAKATIPSPTEPSALYMRSRGARERKNSLAGDVSVERLGMVERDKDFKDATEDINQENDLRKELSSKPNGQ
ncbi:glycerol-3-phosphate O-acyltransferase [Rickenella mellea]|uniref:Glycerol-3-phosphate O-acyltransferase n=1 Tax=Rickenella mellea TaxID=50990 RepID=A0A4Y7QIJ4_9AGAM|nr:glycerol-3-phosphate O-acyltransferase [Rickenella mellea]